MTTIPQLYVRDPMNIENSQITELGRPIELTDNVTAVWHEGMGASRRPGRARTCFPKAKWS